MSEIFLNVFWHTGMTLLVRSITLLSIMKSRFALTLFPHWDIVYNWNTAEWKDCACNGMQIRDVQCLEIHNILRHNQTTNATSCDPNTQPVESQSCVALSSLDCRKSSFINFFIVAKNFTLLIKTEIRN
jgi:hypothetical protein